MVLQKDGSGTLQLQIRLHPLLVRYHADLALGFSPQIDPKNLRIFDLEALRARLAKEPNLTLVQAQTPSSNALDLVISFPNIQALTANPASSEIFRLKSKQAAAKGTATLPGGGTSAEGGTAKGAATQPGGTSAIGGTEETLIEETLTIQLNRERIHALFSLAPEKEASLYQMLLPPPHREVSEEAYKAQLAWALEEYAPPAELDAALKQARLELLLRTPGTVLRVRGGVQEGPQQVRFTLPLLTLLTRSTTHEVTYLRE
ncbi:MAG: hypothetical protein SNJ78_11565 [Spirochaetales bacterium]